MTEIEKTLTEILKVHKDRMKALKSSKKHTKTLVQAETVVGLVEDILVALHGDFVLLNIWAR